MKKYSKYPEWLSCYGKKQYDNINEANDIGISSMYNSNYKIQLYIYECEYCNKYHLTNKETDIRVI